MKSFQQRSDFIFESWIISKMVGLKFQHHHNPIPVIPTLIGVY